MEVIKKNTYSLLKSDVLKDEKTFLLKNALMCFAFHIYLIATAEKLPTDYGLPVRATTETYRLIIDYRQIIQKQSNNKPTSFYE